MYYTDVITIGAETEEKETICCEDLDAVVVEVRDENVSMRVDGHVVRTRQLAGRAASTAKLALCFSLRSEDKHRAALGRANISQSQLALN